MTFKKTAFLYAILFFAFNSCVEPFDYKTISFESALVVEARITSENKKQTIKISRTIKIETFDITPEPNAIVTVIDDLNNTFNFTEDTPGNYISDVSFEAKPNVSYQLKIKTEDNKTYESINQKMTGTSVIQDVVAKATVFADNGGIETEGITISVESNDPNRNSNYYRFEYEETYKVVAPLWVPKKIEILSRVPPYAVKLVDKTEESKTCYKTNISNKIIQTETFTLTEDRVKFPVKFIPKTDFSIKYRYSTLVKQYIQTREAYTFYKTLNKLSSTESLFSQNQPGTLVGNVYATDNERENVLGFFEITSVSSKRIFFNYTDFYDKSTRPDHIQKCLLETHPLSDGGDEPTSPLIYILDSGTQVYHKTYARGQVIDFTGPVGDGAHILAPKSCGDCRADGSNIKPTFWVE